MNPQLWWYVARASGLTAWVLAALSVIWGVALSGRVLGKAARAPWLLDLHRFLGALTVVFTAVHLAGLWADSYVSFGPAELFVPFASAWKPGPVAWGVVAFYLLVAIEVTSLAMRRIPKRWWRAVHFTSYALLVLATVHLFTAGTERENPVVQVAAIGLGAAALFATAYRVLDRRRAGAPRRIAGAVTARTPVTTASRRTA